MIGTVGAVSAYLVSAAAMEAKANHEKFEFLSRMTPAEVLCAYCHTKAPFTRRCPNCGAPR